MTRPHISSDVYNKTLNKKFLDAKTHLSCNDNGLNALFQMTGPYVRKHAIRFKWRSLPLETDLLKAPRNNSM